MKIRNGFVGNSSSASFTLQVNKTFEEIVSALKKDCFDYFFVFEEDLREKVRDAIEEEIEEIKEEEIMFPNISSREYFKKAYELDLKNIECFSEENLFKYFIKLKDKIMIEERKGGIFVEEKNGNIITIKRSKGTVFIWNTTMLNDYASSVPELIKELLLLEKIDNSFETELIVEKDHI